MNTVFEEVPIQNVRQYWDERPCNIRHSAAPVGTRQYFDEVEHRKYFVEPHIPAFADFEQWRGKRVLEIGCGIGTDTMNFARAGAHVTAVDLSSESLKVARQRAEVFGLSDKIKFFEANAEDLSYFVPASHYDLVYSFGVIHHSPHPHKIIREIRESFVGPDSTLKLMVYHRNSWKVMGMVVREGGRLWKLDEIIAKHSEAQTGCPITYSYTRSSIRDLLAPYFSASEILVEHIFPYVVPSYVEYQYEKKWYFRFLPENAFRALEKRLGWHLCVTAKPV